MDKPFDLAIVGELNLDLILYGLPRNMETERELLATAFVSTLGSSSAIVAHNAARLGLSVTFATLVGNDDFGRAALHRLRAAGVDLTEAIVDPQVNTGVTVLLPHASERHILTFPGAIAQLRVRQIAVEHLLRAKHLHLSSLYLQIGLHEGLPELLRKLKDAGLSISLDPNDDPSNVWGEPLQQILPMIDLFMPNEDELCRMAGIDDPVRAIVEFAPSVPVLVMKQGRRGCSIRSKGNVTQYDGLPVSAVDAIGAGDSFDAGFLTAYLQSFELEECARAGNITGALSTLQPGGTEAFLQSAMRVQFLQEHGFPCAGG